MAVEAEVLLPGAALQKRPRLAPAPESSRQTEANDGVTVGEDPPSCNHSAIFLVILLLNPSWQPCLPSFYCFISTFVSPFFLSKPSFFILCPPLTPPTYTFLSLGPSYLAYWFSSFVCYFTSLFSLDQCASNFPWFFYFSTSLQVPPPLYLRFTRILHTSLPYPSGVTIRVVGTT